VTAGNPKQGETTFKGFTNMNMLNILIAILPPNKANQNAVTA
jgi:hypothetical protein